MEMLATPGAWTARCCLVDVRERARATLREGW
jgi:hypothetical protein